MLKSLILLATSVTLQQALASSASSCRQETRLAAQAALKAAQKSYSASICPSVANVQHEKSSSAKTDASLFRVSVNCRTTKKVTKSVLIVKNERGQCEVKSVKDIR
ncbi:MAG: hypothetical protein ACK5Y2_09315 [Bdellovibrionales bacterium]